MLVVVIRCVAKLIVFQNERTLKAANIAHENTLNKSVRAKEIRNNSEVEWRKNLQLIRRKDKELIEKMKVS